MALILIHLRRIVLIFTVVYFGEALLHKLLHLIKNPLVVSVFKASGSGVGAASRRQPTAKKLHFQSWIFMYIIYLYIIVVNISASIGWSAYLFILYIFRRVLRSRRRRRRHFAVFLSGARACARFTYLFIAISGAARHCRCRAVPHFCVYIC